jgi:hypothetical protein
LTETASELGRPCLEREEVEPATAVANAHQDPTHAERGRGRTKGSHDKAEHGTEPGLACFEIEATE